MKFSKLFDNVVCQLSHWKNKNEFDRIRSEVLEGFDRLNCIYIHIPKAAGISINLALYGNQGGGHTTVRAYKRVFGPTLYQQYFKFTFVRNPYSRLLSAYSFLQNGGINENDRKWASNNLSEFTCFDEFVRVWLNENSIWSYTHFKPQYSFVCDIGYRPEVDFIGRVESINEDFKKVCCRLNISNRLGVHNKGKNSKSNWRKFYTAYSLQKVGELYKRDFEIFNYELEPHLHE